MDQALVCVLDGLKTSHNVDDAISLVFLLVLHLQGGSNLHEVTN